MLRAKGRLCTIWAALVCYGLPTCFATPYTPNAKKLMDTFTNNRPPQQVPNPAIKRLKEIIEELLCGMFLNCAPPGTIAAALVFSSLKELGEKLQNAGNVISFVKSEIKRFAGVFREQIEGISQLGVNLLSPECREDAEAQKTIQDMQNPRILDTNPNLFHRLLLAADKGRTITASEINGLQSEVREARQKLPLLP
jgi:hypothetical protein